MTALVATANTATASVLLQVTGAPAGDVTISATDPAGIRTVRLRVGQTPISGALTVSDYEAPFGVDTTYTVTDALGGTATATARLTVVSPVISAVGLPQHAVTVALVTTYRSERVSSTVEHDVIGRPDWLLTMAPLRRRRGDLRVWCQTYADAASLEALAARGDTLQFRQPTHGAAMDMYFAARAAAIEPAEASGTRWQVTLSFTEQARPTTPLQGGAGWTCASVASWGSCAQVRSTFPSCSALVVGP